MFKEIETELLSIMSDDPIDKIAHTPSIEIAKTMELLYNIKFEHIQRVYTENMGKLIRMVVVYQSEDNKIIEPDLCPINGKLYHITFFPSALLDKSENNAITLTRAVIDYISLRLTLIIDYYKEITRKTSYNLFSIIQFQAIPIITCAVIKKLYAGPNVPKIVYMTLTDTLGVYKKSYLEEGINSIFNILDEGLGVTELLDSGFICTIKRGDKNYPGIWGEEPEDDDSCDEE